MLADISADLTSLIPSVRRLESQTDASRRQFSFNLEFASDLSFNSRVISDGTIRLLDLLIVSNDPERHGTLCFEEPENGVHEGRVETLIEFLRSAAGVETDDGSPSFQILANTHSPKVMSVLCDNEIVAADSVVDIEIATHNRSTKTWMRRSGQAQRDIFDPETRLSRSEVARLLQNATDAA